MQTIPTGWAEARSGLYRWETSVSVNSVDYGEADIISVSTSSPLFSSSAPSIGCCVSKEIDLAFVPKASIPRMAEIKAFTRPVLSGVETERLQKGVFYIDTRETNEVTGVMTVHGFDAMLKTEQPYCPDASGTWPRAMSTVVSDICKSIGVTLDSRTTISSSYVCQLDTTLTMRQYLSYIAVAHGGNWVITDAGKLRLVPFVAEDSVADLGKQAQKLESAPVFQPITKVVLWCTDEEYFAAGDEAGRTIEADFPWATQEIANAVLAKLNGYVYQPRTVTKGALPPEVEIGDTVTVNDLEVQVAEITTTFGSMCLSDFAAPADEEIDHEYHYVSTEKRLARQVSKMSAELRVTAEDITARVENAEGMASEAQQTAEGFSQRITDAEGNITEITSSVDWISQRVTTAEGDATEALQTAEKFETRITDAEGHIVTITASLDGVVYEDSLREGTTTISGDCITTGTIDAERIDVDNLTVYSGNIDSLDVGKLRVDGAAITADNPWDTAYHRNVWVAEGASGGGKITLDGVAAGYAQLSPSGVVLIYGSDTSTSTISASWEEIIETAQGGGTSTAVFG